MREHDGAVDAAELAARMGLHMTTVPLEDRAALVGAVFARMGFGPELTPAATSTVGTPQTIRLHACPVWDLARAHAEVGCALHRGLLQGLLASPAATEGHSTAPRPVTHAELQLFVRTRPISCQGDRE